MTDTRFAMHRAEVLDGVPHAFFGSAGGAHQFGYGGPGDADEVRRLRAEAARVVLSGAPLAAPHQVHSPDVLTVTRAWPDNAEGRPVADALVTDRRDIVLGIVTADCGPVLLADAQAGVVGAAHAGWRGGHDGVLENTIAAMEALGASRGNIAAALGPMIAQPSYEVDAAFREHFTAADERHFAQAPRREGVDRWHFDLPGYIAARLGKAGIGRIEDLRADTFTLEGSFHSYRRASRAGAATYGRQLSAIAVPR